MNETKPKRRWLRFSLRTLFALTTFACVVVCLIVSLARWIENRNEFIGTHRITDQKQIGLSLSAYELSRPGVDRERTRHVVLRRQSGPVGLMVRESEFAEAKRLLPDVDWDEPH
jgi:hypothetical protein